MIANIPILYVILILPVLEMGFGIAIVILNYIIYISASGYVDKYFETYIAVDPASLLKGDGKSAEDSPLTLIIIISSLSVGTIIGLIRIYWVRRSKRETR